MALSNRERIGKCLDILRNELTPFVERELKQIHGTEWMKIISSNLRNHQKEMIKGDSVDWDVQGLLQIMWDNWNSVFGQILGRSERNITSELREIRNKWAHQKTFSTDDSYRALDSMERLLQSVSSNKTDVVSTHKHEVMRIRFDEQTKYQIKKSKIAELEGKPDSGLKPWREVIMPHEDVATGKFVQAEFAADLWQVYLNQGSDEYRDPISFYKRTYITEGLEVLLSNALKRLSGISGEPVIELQTNFGGGKTHSMLALYHLFGGHKASELLGADALVQELKIEPPKKVHRAVIAGTNISPGQPHEKDDGTIVHTLWGEIAWQLGGKEGYDLVENDDKRGTNPGELLKVLFDKYSPCLIMIDEWVAYARQLGRNDDLPSGTLDTHFTFVQMLTQAAKTAKNTLLVVSVPASDNEIGGEVGQRALSGIKQALGRVETPWKPATPQEGFEIVRRRLFNDLDSKSAVHRDTVISSFYDAYQTQHQEFPVKCKERDYKRRLESAYPIHPQLFDFLLDTWSTLDRFQKTRGVLRLMSKVIHALWEREDKNLLILPATIPLDDPYVQAELTSYLEDQWEGVLSSDIDGPDSFSVKTDRENPNLGRFSATRRVARTIFVGSAPIQHSASKGVSDKEIKLGCFQPGETAATFGDALRKLDGSSYLNEESGKYWFTTSATIATKAKDLAANYEEQKDDILREILEAVKRNGSRRGEFSRVHIMPSGPSDVPDDLDTRLVILPTESVHTAKSKDSKGLELAKQILESKGTSPRLNKNSLIFLSADKEAMKSLIIATAEYLAWKEIEDDKEKYDLTQTQVKTAIKRKEKVKGVMELRIPETFMWMLYPTQMSSGDSMEWVEERLTGHEPLAEKTSRKLINAGQLASEMAPVSLRCELDRVPLWQGNHVNVKDLTEYFARYLYLPRIKTQEVILKAIEQNYASLMFNFDDTFVYAQGYDESKKSYLGLVFSAGLRPLIDGNSCLVKSEIAEKLRPQTEDNPNIVTGAPSITGGGDDIESKDKKTRRFHASFSIDDSARISRDIGTINQEILSHLTGLVGANCDIRLEVQINVPDGIDDDVVRTISENANTLNCNYGFEEE